LRVPIRLSVRSTAQGSAKGPALWLHNKRVPFTMMEQPDRWTARGSKSLAHA